MLSMFHHEGVRKSNKAQTAWITGASSGLGAEYARQLAARGMNLVLVARREDRLRELAAKLGAEHGVTCRVVVADLSSNADVERLENELQATGAEVDLLVNNAGFGTLGLFWQTPPEGQVHMHEVHVMATMRLTRAALVRMTERDRGAVINVSSVAAFTTSAGNVSYCATKTWMNRFCEGLHVELRWKRSNVQVQALCPGFTYTEFHDTLGVDRAQVPGWMWLSAEFVVADSLRALDRRQWLVIPGLRYRLLVGLTRWIPQWLLHRFYIRAGIRGRKN